MTQVVAKYSGFVFLCLIWFSWTLLYAGIVCFVSWGIPVLSEWSGVDRAFLLFGYILGPLSIWIVYG